MPYFGSCRSRSRCSDGRYTAYFIRRRRRRSPFNRAECSVSSNFHSLRFIVAINANQIIHKAYIALVTKANEINYFALTRASLFANGGRRDSQHPRNQFNQYRSRRCLVFDAEYLVFVWGKIAREKYLFQSYLFNFANDASSPNLQSNATHFDEAVYFQRLKSNTVQLHRNTVFHCSHIQTLNDFVERGTVKRWMKSSSVK